MSEQTGSEHQELFERELVELLQAKTYPFEQRTPEEAAREVEPQMHVYGPDALCITDDSLGKATPRDQNRLRIVLEAPFGSSIPLWAEGTTLRWRFRERSLILFRDPEGAKTAIQELLGAAVLAWGDAVPIKFAYSEERADFDVAMNWVSDCIVSNGHRGCVLASAFFPGGGAKTLWLYPELFGQSAEGMVRTMTHELGHTFGLRHYFAPEKEARWPSKVFGTHKPFSIMNYGSQSVLTEDDKDDLKRLYEAAWSRELTEIDGTPIRLVEP